MKKHIQFSTSLLVLAFISLTVGCVSALTQVPQAAHVEDERIYSATYNKVWGSLMAVLQEEVITVLTMDKNSGLVSGTKNIHTSTPDLIMGYTNRYLINIFVQKKSENETKVGIRAMTERNFKNQGWNPYHTWPRGTGYEVELYDKIGTSKKEIQSTKTVPTPTTPKLEPASSGKGDKIYLITIKTSNVRATPNTKSQIIAVMKKGTKLEKISESREWFEVKVPSGETGHIFKPLVVVIP